MLFPWAKSNLKEYWWGEDPINTTKSVQWLASQCRGLAEGLQKIHRSPSEHATDFGIHGDIKPENILLFVNETHPDGILVISDFGFTRFHGRDTRSNRLAIGSSPTNRAPEIDLKHPISRLYDIWALGCVFVEFITWYLTGKAGMEAFMNRRIEDDVGELKIKYDKFFNIRVGSDGKNEPEVKHSVNEVGQLGTPSMKLTSGSPLTQCSGSMNYGKNDTVANISRTSLLSYSSTCYPSTPKAERNATRLRLS